MPPEFVIRFSPLSGVFTGGVLRKIANGTLAQMQNPKAPQRPNAERFLLCKAVEKFLRFAGPVEFPLAGGRVRTWRSVKRFSKSSRVHAAIASAIRDEAHWQQDADALDAGRVRPATQGLHQPSIAFMQAIVTHSSDQETLSLAALGWSAFFADQLEPEEESLARMRVATVHRARLTAQSELGPVKLNVPNLASIADYAVGDWILVEPGTQMPVRRLNRKTTLQRRTEGGRAPQLIAANVDTLFIVSSCNDDLNPARLERYLAIANEAGTTPVIVLTKADQVVDAGPWRDQVAGLQRGLEVVTLNAIMPDAAVLLAPWCGVGQTVALVGSSGVGKSSLLNTLAAKSAEDAQLTGSIRESDAKGRHTTTSRSLHRITGGGWAIDTPGIRTLHVSDISVGLDLLFAEIAELAPHCRFRDCTHAHEPGCAVQKAVLAGTLDPARLERWRKLLEENRTNTPVQSGPRGNKKTKTSSK